MAMGTDKLEFRLGSGCPEVVKRDGSIAKSGKKDVRVRAGGRGGGAECLAKNVLVSRVYVPRTARSSVNHHGTLFTANTKLLSPGVPGARPGDFSASEGIVGADLGIIRRVEISEKSEGRNGAAHQGSRRVDDPMIRTRQTLLGSPAKVRHFV